MEKGNVIINKYYGGLVNQMFQYAFGLGLVKLGKIVIADTSLLSLLKKIVKSNTVFLRIRGGG